MTEQGNASAVATESAPVTSTTSAAPASTTEVSASTSNSTETSAAAPGRAQASTYSPNFKFKVLDQEREFDEWIRPVVKDAESEKRVRDILERAYGIDAVKADRAKIRESFQTLQQEKAQVESSLTMLSQMVRAKDPRFFKAAQIPDEFVLEAAHRILKEREMPPEQRMELQRQREIEERYQAAVSENQHLMHQFQQNAAQTRTLELQTTLQSPEVSTIVSTFDAKVGAGAFRAEVIRRGQWYWATQQVDKPVQELVQEVGQLAKAFIGENQGVTAAPEASANVVMPQTTPTQKVIPNIEGKGVSPAKKAIKDISDLKAMRTARLG